MKIEMTSDESIAQYYLRFCKCAAECDNGFDEASWKADKNSIFDRFMNTLPKEIRDALEPFHTREEFMLYTPTACITKMNRIISAMSHTQFRGRYSGDLAKRRKSNADDVVNAADADGSWKGPWNKQYGHNFDASKLSQEHRNARYKAGMCFNCGSKQHTHANCPHDDRGVSKPGSHGKPKPKAKGKGKGKGSGKGAKGGRDQAHAIEPSAKQTKKAKQT